MPVEVEMILMKQVASYLAMPIFLVDVEGTLLFYNEPAEVLLGLRYDETGEMAMQEWGTVFVPTDADGEPLAVEQLPLAIALRERRPAPGESSSTEENNHRRRLHVHRTRYTAGLIAAAATAITR